VEASDFPTPIEDNAMTCISDTYQRLIERILLDHMKVPYAHGDIAILPVFDHEHHRYLIMLVGRDGNRRVHGCLIHIDLIDDQIWIQRDGTEYGVARELIDAGVPREDILLAFQLPAAQTAHARTAA
jgi:XisI protein